MCLSLAMSDSVLTYDAAFAHRLRMHAREQAGCDIVGLVRAWMFLAYFAGADDCRAAQVQAYVSCCCACAFAGAMWRLAWQRAHPDVFCGFLIASHGFN